MSRATASARFDMNRVKRKSVEILIYSLVDNITSVTETFQLPPGENPSQLVDAVERGVNEFLNVGYAAVQESLHLAQSQSDIDDLERALQDVRDKGSMMIKIGDSFIHQSSSIQHRAQAIEAGRSLLYAMAHMLIIADQIDISYILKDINETEGLLDDLGRSKNIVEIDERYCFLEAKIEELSETVRRRISDLRDSQERENLQVAKAQLKSSAPLVYHAVKCYIQHPSEESLHNVQFAHSQAKKALDALRDGFRGTESSSPASYSNLGNRHNLASMFNDFQNKVYLEPGTYRANRHKPELENILETIISRAGSELADTGNTRMVRKSCIVDECNKLRQALQHLLDQYEESRGSSYQDEVDRAMVHVGNCTKDLKRHLRRAAVDHVSDAFLDTSTSLCEMIERAKASDPNNPSDIYPEDFETITAGMIRAAKAACEMSSDQEGVRIIYHLCNQLEKLTPEVVNAARLLAHNPDSKVAQENMQVFREAWESKVQLLTMAVDSIITLDDFLAVSEYHIIEDVQEGDQVLKAKNYTDLDRVAGRIRGRARRVCSVVDTEIDALPVHGGSDKVKSATKRLRDRELPHFEENLYQMCMTQAGKTSDVDHDKECDVYMDSCSLVLNGVKEIRNALLLNRNPDDVDSDNEYEEDGPIAAETAIKVTDTDNQQKIMRCLPEQDKKIIQEQLATFKLTQSRFEREVAKWDETGNDIIVLAKHMCMIMMNMTDFTRGRGPLKTTMDVIAAAQAISVDGTRLCALAKQIAQESADSISKNDLVANLSKIPTYCQQLNICSKVKADVQQVGDSLVVTGLDSAMSLIQTARNLLSAVVQTVKDAYIASTKFRRPNSEKPRIEWQLAPPQKHPLVQRQRNNTGVIRRASERRPMHPEQALAQFR